MPGFSKPMTAESLKAKVLEDKAAYRRHLATLPISEKLRMLEEMREATRLLQPLREANKAKIRRVGASHSAE